ncbi:MAG: hypothetical protein HQ567_27635, partial [Candidatus Nealsonbacteria bacterium]|nr:hypothetical protein [Candidatus Nealsonbacteria bacterium]
MLRSLRLSAWVVTSLLILGAIPMEAALVVLVNQQSDWYYLDDGSNQQTTWRAETFDHVAAGWQSGQASLGYGLLGPTDTAVAPTTILSFGPEEENKYVTTYFRRSFDVDPADVDRFAHFTLGLLRDDAAAVYLNGVEIYRDATLTPNAPFDELASGTAIGGQDELTFIERIFLSDALHAGTNSIAVEVHQINVTSSDVGMDLYLIGDDEEIDLGAIGLPASTGFEEAFVGAISFERDAGETELAWTSSGTGTVAWVDDEFIGNQFHLNEITEPFQLTTEKINVTGYSDVQVSIDLRTFLATGAFEPNDEFALSMITTTDGLDFDTVPWMQLNGAELTALNNEEFGPFTTFASPFGLVDDDVVSLSVVIDAIADSTNEHVLFDNLQVTGAMLEELQWVGSDGAWGQILPGPPQFSLWIGGAADALPVADSTVAVIDEGAVTVDAPAEAYRLTVNGGSVAIGAGQSLLVTANATFADGTSLSVGDGGTLDAGGTLDFGVGTLTVGSDATLIGAAGVEVAAGTTLEMGTGATLRSGGGSIDRVVTHGNVTFDASGTATLGDLSDAGIAPGTFTKQGTGTLVLGAVSPAERTFRVEAGVLWDGGPNPLGGAKAVTLAGGTLEIEGGVDIVRHYGALAHNGYMRGRQDGDLNFEGNGGLLAIAPSGSGLLTNGPGDRGLDFNNDADFRGAGVGITGNDNYQSTWTGGFNPSVTGTYNFTMQTPRDAGSLWIDLDRDGLFESGEAVVWAPDNNQTVSGSAYMVAGETYNVAIGHAEAGWWPWGSQMELRFATPPGGGIETMTTVKPGDPAQTQFWSTQTEGIGTVDLTDMDLTVTADSRLHPITDLDARFGELTLQTGILTVSGAPDGVAFGSTTLPESATATGLHSEVAVDPGHLTIHAGLLRTSGIAIAFDGTTIPAAAVAVSLDPRTATDYGVIDGNGAAVTIFKTGPGEAVLDKANQNLSAATFDAQGGTLVMSGLAAWGGSTDVQLSGGTIVIAPQIVTGARPGLTLGSLPSGASADEVSPNPENIGVDPLGPSMAESDAAPPWAENTTLVYSGQFYDADGSVSFYENFDDAVQLKVGGQVVLEDGTWNIPTSSGALQVIPGWTDFELRLYNGAAQAGPADLLLGFGYDPTGAADGSTNPADYTHPQNSSPAVADVFRTLRYGPADMTTHHVMLTADSSLTVDPRQESLALGPLTMENGILTTGGSPVSFTSTTIVANPYERTVGFDTTVDTVSGPIDGNDSPALIVKAGPADLLVDQPGRNLDYARFEVTDGRLIGVYSSNPFGRAALQVGGGEIVLSAGAAAPPLLAFGNDLFVAADGTLTVGAAGNGAPGPRTVLLSGPNGIGLNQGILTVRTTDYYSLFVTGRLSGSGGIRVEQGDLTLSGGDAGSLEVAGGNVHLAADLEVGVADVSGGLADTGVSHLIVADRLIVGQTEYAVAAPSTFTAAGANLLAGVDLTVAGGNLTIRDTGGAFGPLAASTNITVTADAQLGVDPGVTEAWLGNLTVRQGTTSLVLAQANFAFADVTVADGATILGTLSASQTVAPGGHGTVATMAVDGTLQLRASAVYACDVDPAQTLNHDNILVRGGTVRLDGELSLATQGAHLSNANLGHTTRTIIKAEGTATIVGQFATVTPEYGSDPANFEAAHLGGGVFNERVRYVGDPGAYTAVEADLFTAGGGDFNGDERVDGLDFLTLSRNWTALGQPANRSWTTGDSTNLTGTRDGDGSVDGLDLFDLSANWTGDPGPADSTASWAIAEYNPSSGEFIINVDNVTSWLIVSDGLVVPGQASAVLPLVVGGMVTDNINYFGEATLFSPFSSGPVSLGIVAEAGLTHINQGNIDDYFTLRYSAGLGQPTQTGLINVLSTPPDSWTWDDQAGTLVGAGTIHTDLMEIHGRVAPGTGGVGTLTLGSGTVELTPSATYDAQVNLAKADADRIEVSAGGTLRLAGTLVVSGIDRTDAGFWASSASRRIAANSGGTIAGGFDNVIPAPAADESSHVGQGAFLRGVDTASDSVDLDLFIALGGDADGDGQVWLSDWAALRAKFGNTGTGKT